MRLARTSVAKCTSGQALVETALVLPVVFLILLNAINFGYFYLVALNLAATARTAVSYSVQSVGGVPMPQAGPPSSDTSVSYLAYRDMTGALFSPANTPVQVCSKSVGLNNAGTASQTAQCASFGGSASFPAPVADPESPAFVLHRVDVVYTFRPLIPGTPFGILLLPSPICSAAGINVTCTFRSQVSMRALEPAS